jgi:Shugoshin C terminus
MNLATRWREAMNHIQALKKELAIQQYRATEAIAQQKQLQMALSSGSTRSNESMPQNQTRSSASDLLGEASQTTQNMATFQEVALEMDRMDQILAAHQSKALSASKESPPPIPKDYSSIEEASSEVGLSSPAILNISDESASEFEESDDEEKKTQSMDQPVTPSPEKEHNLSFEDDDVDDEFEHNNEHGVNFFAPAKKERVTRVDLDELDNQPLDEDDEDEDEDEPLLDLSPTGSEASSESPPPSPTRQAMPPKSDFQDDAPLQHDNGEYETDRKYGIAAALFPMTASPVLSPKAKVVADESFPPDITSAVVKHPRSADRRTPPDFKDIDEEEDDAGITPSASQGSLIPPLAGNSSKPMPLQPILSSAAAAFEQSFQMEFPASFSPSAEANKIGSQGPLSDGFHPFFPSPMKETLNENTKYYKTQVDAVMIRRGQADNAPSPVYANRPARSFAHVLSKHDEASTSPAVDSRSRALAPSHTTSASNIASSNQMPRVSPILANVDNIDGQTNPSTPKGPVRYQTPPQTNRSPESLGSEVEEPKRPEKAGAAAARARYEKALQPRGFTGNSRRFPRRAEREVERGASPVSNLSAFAHDLNTNNGLTINTSYPLVAQARVQERTSAFTGISAPARDSMKPSSFRDQQWKARPSPTDSVSSKPWDEEIGDIPLNGSSPRDRTNDKTAATLGTGHLANGIAAYSASSPSNNSVRSSYRRLLERNRPWDMSSKKQEVVPLEFSADTAGYSVQQDDLPSCNSDSPTSKFIVAGKSRRQVKQPVSYAEPSLNSKIRQGHEFFPKQDPSTRPPPSTPVHL